MPPMPPIRPPATARAHRRPAPRRLAGAVVPLLLLALLGAGGGCASFDPLGPPSLQVSARSAVSGRGNVFADLREDGVVIVHGWIEERLDRQSVLRAVSRYPGVRGVVDRLFVNDWSR